MTKTAWFDPTNHNHEAQDHTCPACGAGAGAPCVSVVPFARHGVIGVPLRGLHAARVALTVTPVVAEVPSSAERAA